VPTCRLLATLVAGLEHIEEKRAGRADPMIVLPERQQDAQGLDTSG